MAETTSQADPRTQHRTDEKPECEDPKRWNVVLLDDDEHSYEYVIRMMQALFGCSVERGFRIAETVDSLGRAVCLTTHKEHAELKRDQIHAFGRDPLMAECSGSMSAVIEPAEFGDDGSDDAGDDEGGPGGGG